MKHSTFTCVNAAWQRSRASFLNFSLACLMLCLGLFAFQSISAQVAIVRSASSPWGSPDYTNAMNEVFGSGNWDDERFATVDVPTLLANNEFIYLEGSDDSANELEAFLDANIGSFESWVSSGNKLFINSAPNEGDGMSYGFNGVELVYSGIFINDVQAFDPAHPIFDGISTSTWSGTYFGHSIICPPGMEGMLHEVGDNTRVVLAEMAYGNGRVQFGGITAPEWWSPESEADDFFQNMINYIANVETVTCEPTIAITCPADADLECGSDISADALGYPMVEANECVGDLDVTFMDNQVSNDACPLIIARTWVATDGETTEMCTQTITLTDTQAPEFTSFPEDFTVECTAELLTLEGMIDYLNANVPIPTAEDCSEYTITNEFDFIEGECPAIGDCLKTVTATDACGNSVSQTLTVSIIDTEGPVFDAPELIEVSCLEEVPAPADLTAVDACSGLTYNAEVYTANNGELTDTCNISTAFGAGDDWAFWLPTLALDGEIASANFEFDANGGKFDQFADGTAHLYGTVLNQDNPAEGFVLDMWFENKSSWDEWSALGRSYKDDLGCATPEALYEEWMYWEMANGFSTATGIGELEGDVLYFTHMPSNYYFGFQIGLGANNKNCDYGLSGWFTYEGFVNGQAVEGHGDVNVDAECGPVLEQDCPNDTEFTYLHRAIDDCGIATIFTQTVVVNDEIAPEFINFPEDVTVNCEDYPVVTPAVEAVDNCTGEVTVVGPTDIMIPGECANEYVIERSWAAIDICGNRHDQTWTITVIDDQAPEFAGLPEAELTVECDMVPEAADVTVSDNCSEEANIYFEYTEDIEDSNCPGNYTITRTWFAADECENENEFVQTINVQDTTAPTFNDYEFYTQVTCEEVDGYTLTASDNCGEATVEIIQEQLNSGGCMGVLYRIYEATDECGNTATVEQFITILDNTAPELVNIPENETIECSDVAMMEYGNFFSAGDVYGEDNCGLDVEITYSEEVQEDGDDCPESYLIVRTWVATDYCENESMAQQTVTVVDTTDPVFVEFPADETVSCSEELPAVVMPIAEDNCDDQVEIEMTTEELPGECDGEYTLRRIFRGHDNCGNEVMAVQTINVVDNEGPEFTFIPDAASYECNTEIPVVLAEAEDLCSATTVVYNDGPSVAGDCPAEYSFERTFTATDACGNSSTATQTIYVQDTTAPVFAAYDVEIEMPCDNAQATDLAVSDNCSDVEVEYVDTPVSGGCIGRVIRDWTATDACGNTAEAQQIITLTDEVAPEFVAFPMDMVVECDDLPEVSQMLDAEDNCSDVEITYLGEERIDGNCDYNYTLVRTWRATDSCENFTDRSQTITVQDTTAPELEIPADYSASCEEELVYDSADAGDNCSDTSISEEIVRIDGDCAYNYTLERTFTATDACGNTTSATQTITVYDETAPDFTFVPATATYECDEEILVILPEAADNCGMVEITYNDVSFDGECANERLIERTFTATDECGNASQVTVDIVVEDTTAPVFDAYETEIDMPCDDVTATTVSATDNCDTEVEITYIDTPVSGGCAGRIIRDWTATDNCGNSTSVQQIITLIDNVAPVFVEGPMDMTVECNAVPAVGPTPAATDNCTDGVEVAYLGEERIDGNCDYNYTLVRTWRATDDCDNATDYVQTITVQDTTAPELEIPADYSASCEEELVYDSAEAGDNCSDVVISEEIVRIDGNCAYNYTLERTFTATDACGNSTSDTQIITVSDETAPEFTSVPGEASYECDEEVLLILPEAADNCGMVEITYNDESFEGECQGERLIERTFTATDECGNASEVTVYITVVDTTAPVFDAYDAEIDMPCDDVTATTVSATDNCSSSVEITYEDTPVSGGCAGRIIRDWTATDDCGNEASVQQIITLVDNVAPVFVEGPMDMTVECNAVPVVGPTPAATDNCTDEVEVAYLGEERIDGNCDYNYTLVRTWRATDDCDNTTDYVQTITVQDTTAPELEIPADYSASCEEELVYDSAEAGDNCSDVVISEETVRIDGNCAYNYTLERTFTATDACGNSTSDTQIITVSDDTAPEFTSVPSDNELSCDAELPTEVATAEDACGNVTVTFSDSIEPGQCPNNYTIEREWKAEDECGNIAYEYTYYYIYDDQMPMFDQMVSDVNVECASDVPAIPTITATDNCGPATVTVNIDTEFEDECGNTLQFVTFTATDLCGNTNTMSYTISVQDVTAPELSGLPVADLVIDCEDELPTPAEVSALDNCEGELMVDYNEEIIGEQPAEGSLRDCLALTPAAVEDGELCNGDEPWAMKLFNFLGQDEVFFSAISANFVEYPDGTATLTAELVRNDDPMRGWIVDVAFEDGLPWSEWNSQGFPTSFKDDCGEAGDLYQDWTYYIMSAGATLTGWGDNEGSTLVLNHAPSSKFYGYQVGISANNVNFNYGSGGWFTADGEVNGVQVSNLSGDFAFDHDCCPRYSVERTWSAMDCTGNAVSFTQSISFADLSDVPGINLDEITEAREPISKGDFSQNARISVMPNPATVKAAVMFTVPDASRAKVEIFSMNGTKVAELYDAQVTAGQTVQLELDATPLSTGIYLYRLTTDKEVITDRLVIKK